MDPEESSITRNKAFAIVDLPDPVRPTRPSFVIGVIESEMFLRTRGSPSRYRTSMFLISSLPDDGQDASGRVDSIMAGASDSKCVPK